MPAAWPNPQLSIGPESLIRLRRRKIWEATGPALQQFENEIFKAINNLLDAHKEQLESGEQISRTYSLHLWMVGRKIESAVPTIIFTSKSATLRDKVTKLIKKHEILDNYPGFQLNSMDRMPAVPMGPTPQALKTATSHPGDRHSVTDGTVVYALQESIDVCGTLLSVGGSNETTLGGTLIVRGEYYGFIALHPCEDATGDSESIVCSDSELRLDYESDTTSTATASIRISASLRSARNSTLDLSHTNTPTTFDAEKVYQPWSKQWRSGSHSSLARSTPINTFMKDHERLIEPRPIGTMVAVSTQNGLHYGIFHIEDSRYWIPNRLSLPSNSHGEREYLYPREVTSEVQEGEAWIAAGKSGLIKGIIIKNPYFIKLPGSEDWQKMWPMQLERDIVPGDCGSWVIEDHSGRLVGHIVAGDSTLHRAYFIQAMDVFEDIRIKMDAGVFLPVPPIYGNASTLSSSYAHVVSNISRESSSQSLYPGANYLALAEYLSRPERFSAISQPTTTERGIAMHVVVHEWYNLCRTSSKFGDLADFHWYAATRAATQSNALIFLRGLSSPEWIRVLGAAYSVDPEFFQVHLSFLQPEKKMTYFSIPGLPSSSKTIRLRLTTLGKTETKTFESATTWRKDSTRLMQRYLEKLQPLKGFPVGTSIVRKFLCFGDGAFALEQEISVTIIERRGNWTGLVWSDVGLPLDHGSSSWTEQFPLSTIIHKGSLSPVVQSRPRSDLDVEALLDTIPARAHSDNWAQSAAILPTQYGKYLRTDIMEQDPLYAISDLLRFSAASEMQFLNMISNQIEHICMILRDKLNDGSEILLEFSTEQSSNLEYVRKILLDHRTRLEENLAFIRTNIGDRKLNGELGPEREPIAAATTRSIIEDFKHLLQRAESLSESCEKSAHILMNSLTIRESQLAISQASNIRALTFVTILFLPASFLATLLSIDVGLPEARSQIILTYWAIIIPLTALIFSLFWWIYQDGKTTKFWRETGLLRKRKLL